MKRRFLPCILHTDRIVGMKAQCGREDMVCWRTADGLGVTKGRCAVWGGEWQELSRGGIYPPGGKDIMLP